MYNQIKSNIFLHKMNKKSILDAIKLYYRFKSNTEYATFLGIAPQTLSNWYSRNTLDYDLIYSKCVGIDANWLLTGKGSMLKDQPDTLPLAPEPLVQYSKQNDEIKYLKEIIKNLQKTIDNQQKVIEKQLNTIEAYEKGKVVNVSRDADIPASQKGVG